MLDQIVNVLRKSGFIVTKAADKKKNPMKVQSLIFSKDKFKSADEAKKWATAHGFTASKVDETGNSFRLRQKEPGQFKKMRTIEMTDGVKAVVGKSQPSSSQVHVPATGEETKVIPNNHKQQVFLGKDAGVIAPQMTAGELHTALTDGHDNVGGTVRSGSRNGSDVTPLDGKQKETTREKFVFGPLTFDIDKAREMDGLTPNAMVEVSPDWSHQINVDTDAAMQSTSENPVMIAQIPHTNGVENLLIDGHHRMFKALHEGKKELPAHVFSPEESMELCETHPDMKEKMLADLGKARDEAGKVVGKQNPDFNADVDLAHELEQMVLRHLADNWGSEDDSEADADMAEHAEDVLIAHLMENSGAEISEASKDTEEGTQGDISVNGFNNAGARSSGGMGDNVLAGLYDMQEVISGMDWELAHDTTDSEIAREMAISNLEDDPLHYKKLRMEHDATDWSTALGMDGAAKGLNLDLGSGTKREPGFIGFDLAKHDHGTAVHDLHMGIPAPDKSAKNVLLRHSLEHMDELSKDPKPLLAEIQRVLMPGGQFVYEGPNALNNMPKGLVETWREKFDGQAQRSAEDSGRTEKIEGQPYVRQEFASVAYPDAAAANDSEPRIGVAQYDMLPADALLAMDAVGYYWSDATSSGRGNRTHGYPSQGALVKREKAAPIYKADSEKQIAYCVVLAPNETDLQEDWMRPEEIEKAAHWYMLNGQTIGREHSEESKNAVVESFIAPVDIPYDGQYGKQTVKKGSWVIGIKVLDHEDWAKVKSGEYTGVSVGGWGERNHSDGPNDQKVQ